MFNIPRMSDPVIFMDSSVLSYLNGSGPKMYFVFATRLFFAKNTYFLLNFLPILLNMTQICVKLSFKGESW
jgi:hypothetical protein